MNVRLPDESIELEPDRSPVDADAEFIERLVRKRTGIMIRELHVKVQNSDVLLTGRTATYYNKQLATHAVLDVLKGVNLTNDIEVY